MTVNAKQDRGDGLVWDGETTDAHLYLPISVLGSIERHRHG